MSYDRMVKAEAELKAQIDGLLKRARAADDQEKNEPDLDIPGEIKRREDRLKAITEAKLRLEQRQQEADAARGRSKDDELKPRDKDGKPRRGRQFSRDFGVLKDSAQESFTDSDSDSRRQPEPRSSGRADARTRLSSRPRTHCPRALSTAALPDTRGSGLRARGARLWTACAVKDLRQRAETASVRRLP